MLMGCLRWCELGIGLQQSACQGREVIQLKLIVPDSEPTPQKRGRLTLSRALIAGSWFCKSVCEGRPPVACPQSASTF